MNPWIPVVIGLVINALIVAVAFGKWWQTLHDIKERMGREDSVRDRDNIKREKWEERMEDRLRLASHEMLPECTRQFTEINAGINLLTGKVDTLISLQANCNSPSQKD